MLIYVQTFMHEILHSENMSGQETKYATKIALKVAEFKKTRKFGNGRQSP